MNSATHLKTCNLYRYLSFSDEQGLTVSGSVERETGMSKAEDELQVKAVDSAVSNECNTVILIQKGI